MSMAPWLLSFVLYLQTEEDRRDCSANRLHQLSKLTKAIIKTHFGGQSCWSIVDTSSSSQARPREVTSYTTTAPGPGRWE